MSTAAYNLPADVPFSLPMVAFISITKHADRTIAHALDFDLVSVAPSEHEALRKLRLAVKYHVEFGLRNNYIKDILFKAPQEAWDAMTPETPLNIGQSIEISHMSPLKVITIDETRETLIAA